MSTAAQLVSHDDRTLFEKAWVQGIATGVIDSDVSARITRDGARAMRQYACLMGSDYLRPDLERAMRTMLGLINLHLEYESGNDVDRAARSIAVNGIGYHTRGAARHMKAAGYDERSIVTQHAYMDIASFRALIAENENALRRMSAAIWSLDVIGYGDDIDLADASQAICTALLFIIFRPGATWSGDMAGFETMLKAVRAKAKGRTPKVPAGVPDEYRATLEDEWSRHGKTIMRLVLDKTIKLHQLSSHARITELLLVPGTASLSDIDDAASMVTSHWKQLTGGSDDEDVLMTVMLSGVVFEKTKRTLTTAEAKTIAAGIHTPPPEARLQAWLNENAPHAFQSGLVDLWNHFWSEAEMISPDSEARRLAYVKEWVKVGRTVKKAA